MANDANNVKNRSEEENMADFDSGENAISSGLPPHHTLSPDAASLASLLEDVSAMSNYQTDKAENVYKQAVKGDLDPDRAIQQLNTSANMLEQQAGSLIEAMQQLLQGS